MIQSMTGYIRCLHAGGTHRVAWRRWEPAGRAKAEVFCVHGMGRNSRDFIPLALDLASRGYAVTAPDLVGFGRSDYLAHTSLYHPSQYITDCYQLMMEALRMDAPTAMIRANWRTVAQMVTFANPFLEPVMKTLMTPRAHDVPVIWLGTSLGGLIGMNMAAQHNTPIDALILNDVGPEIPARFMRYVRALGQTTDGRFDDINEVVAYLQRYAPGFGPLSDRDWRLLAENSVIDDHGSLRFDIDPNLVGATRSLPPKDVEFWNVWNNISCPIRVLHGAHSQVLLPRTLRKMRGKSESLTLEACGHAPMLYAKSQRDIVCGWIDDLSRLVSPHPSAASRRPALSGSISL